MSAGLREVVDGAAEIVGRERAAGAALRLVEAKYEVVDDFSSSSRPVVRQQRDLAAGGDLVELDAKQTAVAVSATGAFSRAWRG
jgi:hypothetical protein